MTNEPFIAHSELTNEIYIVQGRNKYRVTEQAIHAVKAIEQADSEHLKMTWDKDGACPFCGYFQQWNDDNFCGHCGAKLNEVNQE